MACKKSKRHWAPLENEVMQHTWPGKTDIQQNPEKLSLDIGIRAYMSDVSPAQSVIVPIPMFKYIFV